MGRCPVSLRSSDGAGDGGACAWWFPVAGLVWVRHGLNDRCTWTHVCFIACGIDIVVVVVVVFGSDGVDVITSTTTIVINISSSIHRDWERKSWVTRNIIIMSRDLGACRGSARYLLPRFWSRPDVLPLFPEAVWPVRQRVQRSSFRLHDHLSLLSCPLACQLPQAAFRELPSHETAATRS